MEFPPDMSANARRAGKPPAPPAFEAVLDDAAFGALVFAPGADRRCVYVNPHLTRLTGYALDDVPALSDWVRKVCPDEASRREALERWSAPSKRDSTEPPPVFGIVGRDGTRLPLEARVSAAGKDFLLLVLTDASPRMEVAEALRRSEERYRRLFELPLVGIAITSPSMRWVEVNDRFCSMLGYAPGELAQRTWADLTPAEDRPAELARFAEAMRSRRDHFAFRKRYVRKDGRVIEAAVATSCIRRSDGEPDYMISLVEDVTDRRAAERAVLEERDRARQYVDIVGTMMVVIDADQSVRILNRRACEILGCREAEAPGLNWFDTFVPEGERERTRAVFLDLMRGDVESMESFENHVVTRSGERRLIAWRNSVLRDAAGRIVATLSAGEDITDRKASELALKASEERHRAIFEGVSEGILIADVETQRLAYANPAIARILGYTPEELTALTILDLHPPAAHPRVLGEFARMAESASTLIDELPCRRKDGSVVMADVRGATAVIGGRLHTVGFFTDATARRRAEEEKRRLEDRLRQAQKMEAVGQLAGGIAHDFNNLLTVILGNTELLRMSFPAGSEHGDLVEQVLGASQQAANLTRQLLAFARKGALRTVAVDVHQTVRSARGLLSHAVDRRVEIHLDLQAESSVVLGDPGQLETALLNLGLNARDAMPEGGKITFTSVNRTLDEAYCRGHVGEIDPGEFVEIAVRDTGVGMDRQTQERIFEPFFTTKDPGRGTGLGLAMVYGCVRSHRGVIQISSDVGKGSTFRVLLPVARTLRAPIPADPAGDLVMGRGHILLVDDEDMVRDFAARALRRMGYTVTTFADGPDSLRFYQEHWHEVQLVVLDLVMPKLTGPEVFREMRRINPNVKVLLASGFTRGRTVDQLIEQGAAGFLEKPFRLDQLSSTVAWQMKAEGA